MSIASYSYTIVHSSYVALASLPFVPLSVCPFFDNRLFNRRDYEDQVRFIGMLVLVGAILENNYKEGENMHLIGYKCAACALYFFFDKMQHDQGT